MRILHAEFENFRNFKEKCSIDFPVDSNIAIIYGTNGNGKTTMHQLLHWIIYGTYKFNKTADIKLYNFHTEAEAPLHSNITVYGKIDFEHPNSDGKSEYYSLCRKCLYKKELKSTEIISESVSLLKKIGDDWKPVNEDAQKVIERILPSGLSEYFFFDGESMIADLGRKSQDSARNLRQALYSILGIDVYQNAIEHIGKQTSSTTVLGKLFTSKCDGGTNMDILKAKGDYNQAVKKVEELQAKSDLDERVINTQKKLIAEYSEKIGTGKSRKALENSRSALKVSNERLLESNKREMLQFGRTAYLKYPNLLMAKVVSEAKTRIGLKVEEERLIPGVTKQLIDALIKEEYCICGNRITEQEINELKKHLNLLPPLSYKYMYDNFSNSALRWSSSYDKDALVTYIQSIDCNNKTINKQNLEINEIDASLKETGDVDDFLIKRADAEASLKEHQALKLAADKDLAVMTRIRDQRKKKLDEQTDALSSNKGILSRIDVLEEISKYFIEKIEETAESYSVELRNDIQALIDTMLSGKRKVNLSSKFELSFEDSFGSEAKSEGQFAVTSFAYIGGILKLLSEHDVLKEKEFPLVLDGPFSKLDPIHKQRVINTIPQYAPQIILFSKDDLSDCFDEDMSAFTWTLFSNEEKNISEIKKGYFPEVFEIGNNN